MAETKIPLADLKKVVYNGSEATTVNFGVCTWAKPYTLTLPALPTGVASCTVSRSSTKSSIGTTGTIATAGSTAKTVTVYHGDVISISATAATGYNNPTASLSATTVTGDVTATVTAGTVNMPATLEEATWEQIAWASGNGTISNYYAIGDTKTITLSTDEQVVLRIIGFNHDDKADGSGKAGVTFETVNCLNTKYDYTQISAAASDQTVYSHGWASEHFTLRTQTLPAIFNTLPSDLQAAIKPVTKKTYARYIIDNTVYQERITTTDNLFLLSVYEVQGYDTWITSNYDGSDGTQYAYYTNSLVGSAILKKFCGATGSADWGTRTQNNISTYYGYNTSGSRVSAFKVYKGLAHGVSFGFCI